eukprot:Hpha_TRINITY_DN35919_c0_g1::TRINITY_DN35919_c0_g1_i1::g.184936::m.184936
MSVLLVYIRCSTSDEVIPVEVNAMGTTDDLLREVATLPQFTQEVDLRLLLPGGEEVPSGSLADSGIGSEMTLAVETGRLLSFHPSVKGSNIALEADDSGMLRAAERTQSYNGGLVFSEQPLDGAVLSYAVEVTHYNVGFAGGLVLGFIHKIPEPSEKLDHLGGLPGAEDGSLVVIGPPGGDKFKLSHLAGEACQGDEHIINVGTRLTAWCDREKQLAWVENKGTIVGEAIKVPGVTDRPMYAAAEIYGQCQGIKFVK